MFTLNPETCETLAEDATAHEFVEACLAAYRANFDPSAVEAELTKLREEHDRLVDRWADRPTKRAKDTAAARLADLEARMEELERQQQDAAEVVETHDREMLDLQQAVADAKLAMQNDAGERALRQRAEALRAVIERIECSFVATGYTRGGPGKKNSRLVTVTIYPVGGGESTALSADPGIALPSSKVHSLW
jgi:hypothetical protein